MTTLEERLKALGDVLDDHYGPIALHELGRPQEREDDDLTVVDLRGPGESPASPPRKRRVVVLSVAAAILVVAGVVVVADGNNGSLETEPISSATTPDAVPSPSLPDPAPPAEVSESGPAPSVVDSLGYRWSRVPDRDGAFAYSGIFERGFGGHDRGTYSEWAERSMASVTVGGPGLVAVGAQSKTVLADTMAPMAPVSDERDLDAAVWTSADGITWSRVAHDESVFGGAGPQQMNSVTTRGPGLVAVGTENLEGTNDWRSVVWTSVDGITWSRVPDDETVFGGASANVPSPRGDGTLPRRGAEMTSVTTWGPALVAVGLVESCCFDSGASDAAVWIATLDD